MMRKNLAVGIMGYITQSGWDSNHKCMFMSLFSFLVIGIALFSLPVSTIMVNAQPHSSSMSDGNNHTGNTTGTSKATITGNNTQITQMGICVVGVKSPCNGNK